jgi:hypothetical protein
MVKTMKRNLLNLGAIVLICALSISMVEALTTDIVSALQTDGQPIIDDSTVQLHVEKPLTDAAISALWPTLPSANILWNNPTKNWVDTRDPETAAPKNYTSDIPDLMHASIIRNYPHIWVQYNDSIWVQIPQSQLATATAASDNSQTNPSIQTATALSSWAIGLYSNTSIAGGATVWGAYTTATFGTYSPSLSTDFLVSDVLTVRDGYANWQLGMGKDTSGYFIEMQGWLPGDYDRGYPTYDTCTYKTGITVGTYYNQYIRYNSAYSAWEFYWNWTLIGNRVSDTKTSLVGGNQPNVCAESTDTNYNHFTSYTGYIGTYVNNQYWATIGYLYNGNWVPFNSGDPIPAGYTYYGGSSNNNVIFSVGINNAPSWFGEQSLGTEKMKCGYNISHPTEGTRIT